MDPKYVSLSVILVIAMFSAWMLFLFEGVSEAGRAYCTPESREVDACIEVYEPVCGWFSQEVQCLVYPCAVTYSNSCKACMDEAVEYWTEGECPSPNLG